MVRPVDDLQVRLAAFLRDEMREWEKTFGDEFWQELARLARRDDWQKRPAYFGHLVNELVYDALDPVVAKALREEKRPMAPNERLHRWLTEFGVEKLTRHIDRVTTLAKSCTSMRELRDRVREVFSTQPAQRSLHLHLHLH